MKKTFKFALLLNPLLCVVFVSVGMSAASISNEIMNSIIIYFPTRSLELSHNNYDLEVTRIWNKNRYASVIFDVGMIGSN